MCVCVCMRARACVCVCVSVPARVCTHVRMYVYNKSPASGRLTFRACSVSRTISRSALQHATFRSSPVTAAVAVTMDTVAMTTAVTWTSQVMETKDGRDFAGASVIDGSQSATRTSGC